MIFGAYGSGETDASCDMPCPPGETLVKDAKGPGCTCKMSMGLTEPEYFPKPDAVTKVAAATASDAAKASSGPSFWEKLFGKSDTVAPRVETAGGSFLDRLMDSGLKALTGQLEVMVPSGYKPPPKAPDTGVPTWVWIGAGAAALLVVSGTVAVARYKPGLRGYTGRKVRRSRR